MAEKELAFSVEKELEKAQLKIVAFEEAIQTGEAEASAEEVTHLLLMRDRAKKLLKYRSDVEQIVARPDGRRVLWRILEIAGPNRISHTPGDPYSTAFNEGKRSIANEILLMIFDADQNAYARMQREHLSDSKAEDERKNKIREGIEQ